jgi:hypothetical protein
MSDDSTPDSSDAAAGLLDARVTDLAAAAHDLRRAADTLRQAIANGELPASTAELITRLEHTAARMCPLPEPPPGENLAGPAESE